MQKIVIVGHPHSGYQAIEQWLQQSGMATALPTQRDQLSPADITSTLCKAHGCLPLQSTDDSGQLKSLSPGTVWNTLALDLFMSNLDQPLWGWADPNAIHLLDYWHDLDNQTRFVLVYDRPETAFEAGRTADNGTSDATAPDPDTLQAGWTAYNSTLLNFYLRHRDRCVLVNSHALNYLPAETDSAASQPAADAQPDLDHLLTLLELPLGEAEKNALTDTHARHQSLADQLTQTQAPPSSSPDQILAAQLAAQYPELQQIYADLQAAASLAAPATAPPDKAHLFRAWQKVDTWQAGEQQHRQLQLTYSQIQHEQDALMQENQQMLQQLNEARAKLEQASQQHSGQSEDLQEENKLLLTQLHMVQEELEQASQQHSGQSEDLQEENELLLTQLHLVQEELEHYYLRNQELEKKLSQPAARARATKSVPQPASQRATSAPAAASAKQPNRLLRRLKAGRQTRHLQNSELFDAQWYLQQNPDIVSIPAFARNPALHYLLHGADEGRDPSPEFSTRIYCYLNPDVKEAGLNPLLHYILHGQQEGRRK